MRDRAATDMIAREAARLIEEGRTDDVADAIRRAVEALGLHRAPRPGPGRVRAHLRGRAMQEMGAVAYAAEVRSVLQTAEELLTWLSETFEDAEPILVGRAARGEIDGGVTLHVRLYATGGVGGLVKDRDLARRLVEQGYDEPAFETADTRAGRLSRVRFSEDRVEVVITLCPGELRGQAAVDLFSGRPIAAAGLDDLRRLLRQGT